MTVRTIRRAGASVTALIAVAIAGAVLPQPDARAQAGGNPVNVNAYRCIVLEGGHRTVPAGSTVVIRSGWTTTTSGGVRSFREAQTTLLSVNDGRTFDASGDYDAPMSDQAGWTSLLHHSTNVTLGEPGDTMRFTFALVFDRNVTDVFDYDGDGVPDPTPTGRGLSFGGTCTVTAV